MPVTISSIILMGGVWGLTIVEMKEGGHCILESCTLHTNEGLDELPKGQAEGLLAERGRDCTYLRNMGAWECWLDGLMSVEW